MQQYKKMAWHFGNNVNNVVQHIMKDKVSTWQNKQTVKLNMIILSNKILFSMYCHVITNHSTADVTNKPIFRNYQLSIINYKKNSS